MNQPAFSRREFLTVAAAGTGLSLRGVVGTAGEPVAPPERQAGQTSMFGLKVEPLPKVRIGCVGVGGRGSGLLGNLLSIAGVEIRAICDIVPARVAAAQQRVVARGQAEPAGYSKSETDFENLCGRDDIDLVYIAAPWD